MLAKRYGQVASITVSYTDGVAALTGIPATVGRTPFDVLEGSVMVAYESRDYIIKAAYLTFNGLQLIPRNGARITEADGRVYEVSAPQGFNVYESIGPDGTVFKIHTVGRKTA